MVGHLAAAVPGQAAAPPVRHLVQVLDHRLGRNLHHLITTVTELGRREVGFRSLTEGLDATTPAGRLLFGIMASLAQFERDLIRERTMAGLEAARARAAATTAAGAPS